MYIDEKNDNIADTMPLKWEIKEFTSAYQKEQNILSTKICNLMRQQRREKMDKYLAFRSYNLDSLFKTKLHGQARHSE